MAERFLTLEQKKETLDRAKQDKLCRWCGLDVKRLNPKRRTFCSDECVHEYSIRSSSSFMRKYIAKRDNYTCQICGLNCRGFLRHLINYVRTHIWNGEKTRLELEKEFFAMNEMEWVNTSNRSTFYDIDHIVPVVKGAGQCGEDNLRTVCLRCHRIETAKLRKELRKNQGSSESIG